MHQPDAPTAVIDRLARRAPLLWANPGRKPAAALAGNLPFNAADVMAAAARFARLAPLLAGLFPELEASRGIIESRLAPAPRLAEILARVMGCKLPGNLLVKCDHELPVAGSVKARGGFHAVLKLAEDLASAAGLYAPDGGDPSRLAAPEVRRLFASQCLTVGSTGNLGLSIGLMGRALGFPVTVHMSAEAKAWKKARLKSLGARVVEHAADFGAAVAEARAQAAKDPACHFIDDESDPDLFLGYAAALPHLIQQLKDLGLAGRPVLLFLPCGVGGAPGGISLAARLLMGDAAHPFFAEPAAVPSFLLGLVSGRLSAVSIYDIGLDVRTEADGLAVARPSRLVAPLAGELIDGCFTAGEDELLWGLHALNEAENLAVEPSAAAGVLGPVRLLAGPEGRALWQRLAAAEDLSDPVFIVWSTGGKLLPVEARRDYLDKGRAAAARLGLP